MTGDTSETEILLTHPHVPVTAPIEYWRILASATEAIRVQQRTPPDRFGHPEPGDPWELYLDTFNYPKSDLDSLLLLGLAHGGRVAAAGDMTGPLARQAWEADDGRLAIIWVIEEMQTRREQIEYNRATQAAAQAVRELAAAMLSAGEDEALSRIMGRLTERTQYAVRAQLRGR